jgi:uncharacterized protein with GYD domain
MSTYISLLQYTQQGIENVKDSPARLDAARQIFESYGGRLKEFYLVCGRYDAVVISEAPDDASAAKAALSLATRGNVRAETYLAFPEKDFRNIVSGMK